MITVRMISSTSPGMLPGAAPKPKTRIAIPTPPHNPIPTPPTRAPSAMAARRTISWRIRLSVMDHSRFPERACPPSIPRLLMKRDGHGVEQQLLVHGLSQIGDRTRVARAGFGFGRVAPGDHHHRQLQPLLLQP